MFRKINEGYVISDEGYKIKLGRHHVSYIENNGFAVTFEAEDLMNPYCFLIFFSKGNHYWHPPHEKEKLNNIDLYKIKTRIIEVLNFLNINFEIE